MRLGRRRKSILFYISTTLCENFRRLHQIQESGRRGYWANASNKAGEMSKVFSFISDNLQGLFEQDEKGRIKKVGVGNPIRIPQGEIEINEGDATIILGFIIKKSRTDDVHLAQIHFDGEDKRRCLAYSRKLGLHLKPPLPFPEQKS